jgi:hypothetical protein
VLQAFFPSCPTFFQDDSRDLFILFEAGLKHESNKIKLAALGAFSAYL